MQNAIDTDPVEIIHNYLWGEIHNKLHTCIPGIIEVYDSSKPSVDVKISIKRVYKDGFEAKDSIIFGVPVVFPRTNRFKMSFPLEKGDAVLLIFSEKCMDDWITTGETAVTRNDRIFSTSDAIAIPGLFAYEKGLAIGDGKNLEIEFDDTKIISDGTNIEMTASKVKMGTTTALSGVVTGECLCAFTGVPHADKSSKVFAEK